MDNNDEGEVELLLSDASAVEQKVVDVLLKVFGNPDSGGCGWLMSRLLASPHSVTLLDAHINKLVDIELNRRKGEYK